MPSTATRRPRAPRAADALVALLRVAVRLAHGLRAALGLVLILAIGAALAGTWAFAEVAEQVRAGATQRFDDAVLRALAGLHAPWIETVMLEVTSLGNGTVVTVLALVTGTVLWPRASATLRRKTMIGLARALVAEAPGVAGPQGAVDRDVAAASIEGTLAELGRMIQVGVVPGPARRWQGRLVTLFRQLAG
jgi:hypothetical protein